MSPERKRAIVRIVGLSAFGFVVFVIAFILAFPYDRIKDQLITVASSQNLDVTVEHAGPVFGLGVALDDVMVRSRPDPGKKASVLQIDKARVHVSPLAQLRGVLAYDVALDTLGGRIEADVEAEKTLGTTKVTTRELDMTQMPGVKEAINLTLAGLLDLDLEILAPNHRNAEANGNLSWKWADMKIGDGKEKLKVAGNPLLAEGISLPQVRLGDFAGKIAFQKGVGRLQGVGSRSQDAELRIEGEVRLADPLAFTHLDLYVTFKFTDAMLKKADKLQVMLQLAESMGKRADGFFGFRISGSASRMGPLQWQKTSPFQGAAGTRAGLAPAGRDPAMAGNFGGNPSGFGDMRAAPASSDREAAPVAAPNPPSTPSEPNLPRYATQPPRE